MTRYEHTQTGPLDLILLAVAAAVGTGAHFSDGQPAVKYGLLFLSAVFVLEAASFANLTVRDDGERLAARFGWLPIYRWNVRWDTIESVATSRTSLSDGWGVHWLPGRGWTINLWGYDCVELRVKGRTVRIGTDEPAELAAYIQERIAGLERE